jgi:hypothetical protein
METISKSEAKALISQGITEYQNQFKTYSVNEACKIIGRSAKTINKLIANNILKTNIDGRIPHAELVKYAKPE